MKKITKNWLWLCLFLTLGLMINMGCDSGSSGSGCEPPDPTPTPAPPPTPPPQNIIFEGNHIITNLADLNALAGYTEITGSLIIVNSTSITNLDGLDSLRMIDGNLVIENNSILENIDGLGNVASIGRTLEIIDNDLLTNIDGLKNLTATTSVFISGNDLLASLDGLSNLQTISFGAFSIYCNQSLPIREVNQLRNRLSELGWSGCYYTAITCDPVNTVPHGWCPCDLLPMELAPACWRFPYNVWFP